MDEFSQTRSAVESLVTFFNSPFSVYIDFDTNFAFTEFSDFFISLRNYEFEQGNELFFINKLSDEHTIDAYLSKRTKLSFPSLIALYKVCIKCDDQRHIEEFDNMDLPLTDIFFDSCRCNQVYAINHLIKRGFNINTENKDHELPIHIASRLGYTDIVRTLIDNGANKNVPDSEGFPPLMLACKYSHEETALCLLESGVNIEATNKNKDLSLIFAIRNKLRRVIKK